jgi:septal ring factor EnvC (AmiA/AmiB activator)
MEQYSQLMRDVDLAIAWGTPDTESMGFTHRQFIDLLSRCRKFMILQHNMLTALTTKAPDVEPVNSATDMVEVAAPSADELKKMLEATQQLLRSRNQEIMDLGRRCQTAETALCDVRRQRDENRAEIQRLSGVLHRTDVSHRIEKLRKHLDKLEEELNV